MGFMWYLQESNQGHMDFQSIALPTELRHQLRDAKNIKILHYQTLFKVIVVSIYKQIIAVIFCQIIKALIFTSIN